MLGTRIDRIAAATASAAGRRRWRLRLTFFAAAAGLDGRSGNIVELLVTRTRSNPEDGNVRFLLYSAIEKARPRS